MYGTIQNVGYYYNLVFGYYYNLFFFSYGLFSSCKVFFSLGKMLGRGRTLPKAFFFCKLCQLNRPLYMYLYISARAYIGHCSIAVPRFFETLSLLYCWHPAVFQTICAWALGWHFGYINMMLDAVVRWFCLCYVPWKKINFGVICARELNSCKRLKANGKLTFYK